MLEVDSIAIVTAPAKFLKKATVENLRYHQVTKFP